MASSLYRLLSAGRGSMDAPRDGGASAPTTPRFSSSLPASPSLNDFSMGAAAEFEESCVPSPASALSPRASLDSQGGGRFSFDSARPGSDAAQHAADVRSLLWRNSMPAGTPAYGPPRTPAMPIPSPSGTPVALAPLSPRPVEATSPALTPATPPPSATADVASTKLGARRGRRGGGKIDGLDYYEYVELIRASSL